MCGLVSFWSSSRGVALRSHHSKPGILGGDPVLFLRPREGWSGACTVRPPSVHQDPPEHPCTLLGGHLRSARAERPHAESQVPTVGEGSCVGAQWALSVPAPAGGCRRVRMQGSRGDREPHCLWGEGPVPTLGG